MNGFLKALVVMPMVWAWLVASSHGQQPTAARDPSSAPKVEPQPRAPRIIDRQAEEKREAARRNAPVGINPNRVREGVPGHVPASRSETDWMEEAEHWLKGMASSENPPPFINGRIASLLLKNPARLDEAGEWIEKANAENDPNAPRLLEELAEARRKHGPLQTGLLVKTPGVCPGYTVLATKGCDTTLLIDNDGNIVHQWKHPGRATSMVAYLLPNGNLLHTVDAPVGDGEAMDERKRGAMVEELSWDGDRVWEFEMGTPGLKIHHDIERLPNGNTLMIVSERKSSEECLAVGRNVESLPGGELVVDAIYEVKPTGNSGGDVVWRWSPWDHLIQTKDENLPNFGVPSAHPDRIDVNQVRVGRVNSDWLHVNSVAYNEECDAIMICAHALGEIWVVSHKTGELVYRWGNPQIYGMGTPADRKLYNHHDAHWIPKGLRGTGNILIFNNGMNRPDGDYSSVLEIEMPPVENGRWSHGPDSAFSPCLPVWEYAGTPKEAMYSPAVSGAQRLDNGNTLICIGVGGTLLEVDPSGGIVWKFVNPITNKSRPPRPSPGPSRRPELLGGSKNALFRTYKHAPVYAAFAGRNLVSKGIVEDAATSGNPEE